MFNGKLKARIGSLEAENGELREAIAKVKKTNTELSDSVIRISNEKGKLLYEKGDLQKRLAQAEEKIEGFETVVREMRAAQSRQDKKIAEKNSLLKASEKERLNQQKELDHAAKLFDEKIRQVAEFLKENEALRQQVAELEAEAENYREELRGLDAGALFLRREDGTLRWLPAGEGIIRRNMDLPAKEIAQLIEGVTAREVKNKKSKIRKECQTTK